jgi:hypothetical protein
MTELRILPKTPSAEASERRRTPRVPEELAVRAEVTITGDNPDLVGQVAECTTRDVSTNGLLVRSDLDLPVGCGLKLHLFLPGRPDPLTLLAQVKWNSADSDHLECLLGIELRERPPHEYRIWRERVLAHIRSLDF